MPKSVTLAKLSHEIFQNQRKFGSEAEKFLSEIGSSINLLFKFQRRLFVYITC